MYALLDLIKHLYPLRTCHLNLSPENIRAGKFNVFQILFLTLLPDARSCTVLDVVFQANIELSGTYVFRREVQAA